MPAGTGTPGSNQNGPYMQYSPTEVVTAAGPLSINAPAPVVDISLGSQFVTQAYELMAYPALRPNLIFDQFATIRATRLSHTGSSVRFSFVDDMAVQATPLLENIDVDSIALATRGLSVSMREYGSAVTTTALIRNTSMIPMEPILAERVGYNMGLSVDYLARTALDQTSITYDDATTESVPTVGSSTSYMNASLIQQAVYRLQAANVRPFPSGLYVAVISPTQAQHLKADTTDTGWRYIVARTPNEGNNIYRGEIGTYEGVHIVVNNNMTAQSKGYIMGAEALAKAFSNAPGYGPDPHVVVSPVIDKLKRFASIGWYHLVGYSIFRPSNLIQVTTTANLKP